MIYGIQILRGIAVLMVVLNHVRTQLDRLGGPHVRWFDYGASGVDIFFVISGFIIWVTSQSPTMTPREFFIRRTIRIVPLYWLITLFIVLVAAVAPSLLTSTKLEFFHTASSFLFWPYPHPILHDIRPVPLLVPGWSLNYEMFFYFLFGACLLFPSRLDTLLSVVLILVLLVAAGELFQPRQIQAAYFSAPIVLEFALGLIVGFLYTDVRAPTLSVALIAIVIGALLVVAFNYAEIVNNDNRAILVGLPAAITILGISGAKRHGWNKDISPLVAVGDASYSIYLTHVIVLPAVAKAWVMTFGGIGPAAAPVFVACLSFSAVIVGWFVHRWGEIPIISFLRDLVRRHEAAAI